MFKGDLEIKGDNWATVLLGWLIALNSFLVVCVGLIIDLKVKIEVTEVKEKK